MSKDDMSKLLCETATLDGPSQSSSDTKANDPAKNPNKRRVKRRSVIKSGQLIFGLSGSTVDCEILDESSYGFLVETNIIVQVPDQLTIKVDNGAQFHVIRRWAIGMKIGLELVGPQVIDKPTQVRMQSILTILEAQGLPAALEILRAQQFFHNAILRQAAEDAGSAIAKLQTILKCSI